MNERLVVGKYTYGHNLIQIAHWGEPAQIKIGKFCSIARCTMFLGGNHNTQWATTFPFGHIHNDIFNHHGSGHPKTNGDIVIGNDVWIGQGASIMSGTTIGNGAVIASNAHVVKDVDDYSIVGGNPAKHIKYRFPEDTRKKLLELQWWNWDDQKINKYIHILCSPNIEQLWEKKDQ